MSLLIISLSLLLIPLAFTRDMMNPFSEARATNSLMYDTAGLIYCELSIFIPKYLFPTAFTNLSKYNYAMKWKSQNKRDFIDF